MANYTIVKERNIVKFIDENNTFYALDINSGEFFGKMGKPIKTCPIASHLCTPLYNLNTNLAYMLRAMLSKCRGSTAPYKESEWLQRLALADKLDGMKVPNLDLNGLHQYDTLAANFDIFVKYNQKYPYDSHNSSWDFFRNFKTFVDMQEFIQTYPNFLDFVTIEMYRDITQNSHNLTNEEWGVLVYYLCKQKVWEYDGSSRRVLEYIKYCKTMEKPFVKQANFMREYLETRSTYNLYKTDFDNKRLRKSYEEHSKAFNFSFGDYTVVIPTCAKDIVDEGKNMHHCVGNYVDRVVDGEDYIVFIRHKDSPDKCYITCEIYPSGQIGQYFLAYDNYIHELADHEFKNAFVKHLQENW